jgi:hypothetical protein
MNTNYSTSNIIGGNDLGFDIQGQATTTQSHLDQHGYHDFSASPSNLHQDMPDANNDYSTIQGDTDSDSTPSLNFHSAAPPTGGSESPPSTLNLPPAPASARIPCTYPPCTKTFKRDYERIRHENSMHVNTQGAHLCPVPGCPKSHGKGYSRSDKVTEHLWKKHSNLGYTKA